MRATPDLKRLITVTFCPWCNCRLPLVLGPRPLGLSRA